MSTMTIDKGWLTGTAGAYVLLNSITALRIVHAAACGQPAVTGKPYCAGHCARVFSRGGYWLDRERVKISVAFSKARVPTVMVLQPTTEWMAEEAAA